MPAALLYLLYTYAPISHFLLHSTCSKNSILVDHFIDRVLQYVLFDVSSPLSLLFKDHGAWSLS
jgi:hypothetical protein